MNKSQASTLVWQKRIAQRDPLTWRGARHKNNGGYIRTLIDARHPFADMGYPCSRGSRASVGILEHRLVMAEHLGRPLEADEDVDHINGVRTDNRPENLQLRVHANHGRGITPEEALAWAAEIQRRYG